MATAQATKASYGVSAADDAALRAPWDWHDVTSDALKKPGNAGCRAFARDNVENVTNRIIVSPAKHYNNETEDTDSAHLPRRMELLLVCGRPMDGPLLAGVSKDI